LFKAYILFLRSANGNFQNKYSFIDILFYFCEVRTEIFKKLIRKPEPKLLLTMALVVFKDLVSTLAEASFRHNILQLDCIVCLRTTSVCNFVCCNHEMIG